MKTSCSIKEQCGSKCKTVFIENHVNRESNISELTIWLYVCYDKHEAPISCNTAVYLSIPYPITININHVFQVKNELAYIGYRQEFRGEANSEQNYKKEDSYSNS